MAELVPAADEASTELEDMAALVRFSRWLGLESSLTERVCAPDDASVECLCETAAGAWACPLHSTTNHP